MTDKELIKQEIIRLKNEQLSIFSKGENDEICGTALICIGVYNQLLSFINSLPEEPVSEDLEEAANFYANTHIEWFDSEGNPCVMPAFKAGAKWADQHPRKGLWDSEKVIKWLRDNQQGFTLTDMDIEDLCKAMWN